VTGIFLTAEASASIIDSIMLLIIISFVMPKLVIIVKGCL
jgi:hypothetical protein